LIDNAPIPVILVQNKSDLLEKLGNIEHWMSADYAKKFAKDNKFLDVIQTSAKENKNLD
jgi:predicted GTPase